MATKYRTVDDYIRSFPADIQPILQRVRTSVHKAAPGSGEKISYGIPSVTVDDRSVVYFAGWKEHVSLYPLPAVDEAMDEELAPYKASRGTLKFPLRKPIPYDLIERVTALLVKERLSGVR
jgi:uncharacterized protein YdhG (YjbR/CyaY superfamily)